MDIQSEVVVPVGKMLGFADTWLDLAVDHAKKRSFDPNILLDARLAPDQFALMRQLQAMADNGKFVVARLSGKSAPKHPDTEKTIDEIRTRLRAVHEYVKSFTPADFEGAESQVIALPTLGGMALTAPDYVRQYALPNFYFHAGMAYAILRHNGVELGKRNWLNDLPLRQP